MLGVNDCKTRPFPRSHYVVSGDLTVFRPHSNPELLPMNLFESGMYQRGFRPGSSRYGIDSQTSVNICVLATYVAGISCAFCLVRWR